MSNPTQRKGVMVWYTSVRYSTIRRVTACITMSDDSYHFRHGYKDAFITVAALTVTRHALMGAQICRGGKGLMKSITFVRA